LSFIFAAAAAAEEEEEGPGLGRLGLELGPRPRWSPDDLIMALALTLASSSRVIRITSRLNSARSSGLMTLLASGDFEFEAESGLGLESGFNFEVEVSCPLVLEEEDVLPVGVLGPPTDNDEGGKDLR
jgi:hypothetical protein